MQVWLFHSKQDKVIPSSGSVRTVRALKALDTRAAETKLTNYDGAAHSPIGKRAYSDRLYRWMLQKRCKGKDQKVTGVQFQLGCKRTFNVRLASGKGAQKLGHCSGEFHFLYTVIAT